MKNNKKIVAIMLLFTILLYILINFICVNKVQAVTQSRESVSNKLNNYPGYTELINKLKAVHPNWNFTILYTGLDWNQVIKSETTAHHGRNLVSSSKSNAWICAICGNTKYDNGSWRCASEAAVSYYMDPRNSLNEDYIFQFEALSFNESIQTIEGVKQIISDVKYMQGDSITYTKTDGTKATINKSYAQIIMEAAKEANISPYHLAARIRQEQGTGNTPSAIAKGEYEGFIGYYNFLNINAKGNGNAEIIANALTYAKNKNLTDPEISIKEGAKFLAKDYISSGQDTLYLQKFDVDNSDGALYYFQYMQNVSASKTEATEVRKSYKELGMLDGKIDFIIPVYENMPNEACLQPIADDVVTQNVKVKGMSVRVRQAKSTTANSIATVNTGDTLLRIEISNSKNEGFYWDKVVLSDGKQGYIARTYLIESPDIKQCEDTMVVKQNGVLRNGPGLQGTTALTTLTKGQVVTRIENGKYNLDGYIWDRVLLEDGRQGYIAQNYIGILGSSDTATDKANEEELIKVICNSGLKVREKPGTDQKVLTYLDKNDILTRVKKEVSTANGYIWDEIVTNEGISGYIARGNSTKAYIEVVTSITGGSNLSTQSPNSQTGNNDFKLENDNLICESNTTIDDIKEKYSQKNIVIKKADGTVVNSGKIATSYIITIGDRTYTAVKLGDINGDGEINTGDTFLIKQVIMELKELNTECTKKAADINNDGNINTGDSFILKKHVMDVSKISI